MSTLWFTALALAVLPTDGSTSAPAISPTPAADQQPLVPPRTGTELRDATREALRRWAKPEGKQADLAAREFLALYKELQQDDKLARSQREPLLMKVRGRLLKLAQQISKRVAAEKRRAKSRPGSVDAAGKDDPLAQIGGFGGRGFGQPGFGGQGFGGPAMMGGGPGGQMGMPEDNGEQLVEVIQTTIRPASWEINGGPGTIYYWRPGHSVIIRQMDEVHDEIGGLLEQLRRAGN